MTQDKQQSPNWQIAKDMIGPIRGGFPYSEPWPKDWPGSSKTYTLILCDGERKTGARVDYSTQYRAEGLSWQSSMGCTIGKQLVVAWCEE